jgi:hypothetical protein
MSLVDQRLQEKPCKTDPVCLTTFFGSLALLFVAAPVVVWGVELLFSAIR